MKSSEREVRTTRVSRIEKRSTDEIYQKRGTDHQKDMDRITEKR